ncbi:glycosyltransferase 87 family protein [Zavarzinella formosa]|uniref:glycosyltransferase 87 family protein n=1 Tax=Zavarzinella formosa TaxID=360055 RepID=UPI00030984CB|nr:glycosyltransferase 87 family protein [Zavarzinella formosa]
MNRFATPKGVIALWILMVVIVGVFVSVPGKAGKLFPTFATAGSQFREGETLYGPVPDHLDQFRYSPTVAAMMVPWSLPPYSIGGVLWRALQAGLLLLALRRAVRTLWPEISWPLVALGCLPLIAGNIHNGQFNPLVLALMLFAGCWFFEGRFSLAAIAIAGAALIKVYPLAIGLLLILLEWRRFTPRLVAALTFGAALPYAFQSSEYVNQQYADWWARLNADDRTILPMADGYHDFQKLLRRWGTPVSLETYRMIELAAGGLMAIFLVAIQRQGASRPELIRLAVMLSLVWCCLFGPSSESATYMLLAPAAVLAMCLSKGRERLAAGFAFVLLLGVPMAMWFPKHLRAPYVELVPQAHAALLILGWIVWRFGDYSKMRLTAINPNSATCVCLSCQNTGLNVSRETQPS